MTDNMSDETKRDVFDEVRYKFRNFKNKHRHGMYVSPDSIDHYLGDALKRYAAALPDDLPVIPEVTGKFIKAMKANGDSLFASQSTVYLMDYLDLIPFDALKITKWINEHQNTFARAWVLGVWRVEETGEVVKL